MDLLQLEAEARKIRAQI